MIRTMHRTRVVNRILCQRRPFATSYGLLAAQPTPPKETPAQPVADAPPENRPLADVPRAHGKRVEEFTPTTLSRPIGFHQAPRPGENTGVDRRSLQQRRDDFVNYEKHLARRAELYALQPPIPNDDPLVKTIR